MSENNITEQLKKVASDVLSEETLKEIEEAYTESVASKAEELAQLRVEKALIEQDEDHAVKLEKLLEAIDTDHTSKLKRVVEAIDKNHSEKLVELVKKFRSEIDGNASMFKESLVDNISNYLDLYIEKHIPVEDLQEAVKNRHARDVLDNLRKSLSIDKVMANEQVREAVMDGKRQIDEASEKVTTLAEENAQLKQELSARQAQLMIEKKTAGLPSSKRRHLEKLFEGKSAEYINENYQYALDMFEKTEADKLTSLKKEVVDNKKQLDRVATEKKQVIKESVDQQIDQSEPGLQDPGLLNNYMGELNRW